MSWFESVLLILGLLWLAVWIIKKIPDFFSFVLEFFKVIILIITMPFITAHRIRNTQPILSATIKVLYSVLYTLILAVIFIR